MIEVTSRKSEPYDYIRFEECPDCKPGTLYCIIRGQKTSSEWDEEIHDRICFKTFDQVRSFLESTWMGDRLLTKIGEMK